MVVFALSCFGLLLFLWLSFGGPIPLKPQGYRVQVAFPEATTLATEADVRIAGVSVGKVRKLDVDDGTQPHGRDDRARPPVRAAAHRRARDAAPEDAARRDLRGAHARPQREDDPRGRPAARTGRSRTRSQLDEIFDSLDPATRASFRSWQQELAKGIKGRGRDFNDALGTLPGFAADGADVLARARLAGAAPSSGSSRTPAWCSRALTENEQQLQNLITGSKRTFDATASRNDALAETIRIFPTFLRRVQGDARARAEVLDRHRPAGHDLRPVARDLQADARRRARAGARPRALLPQPRPGDHGVQDRHAGDARGARGRASRCSASSARSSASSTRCFQYLEASQWQVADFLTYGAAALSADTTASPGGGIGPLPAPVRPARRRERGDLEGARARPTAATPTSSRCSLPRRAGRGPGLQQVQDHRPVRLHELGRQARADRRLTRLLVQDQNPFDPAHVHVPGQALQGAFPHVEADDYSSARRRERRQQVSGGAARPRRRRGARRRRAKPPSTASASAAVAAERQLVRRAVGAERADPRRHRAADAGVRLALGLGRAR